MWNCWFFEQISHWHVNMLKAPKKMKFCIKFTKFEKKKRKIMKCWNVWEWYVRVVVLEWQKGRIELAMSYSFDKLQSRFIQTIIKQNQRFISGHLVSSYSRLFFIIWVPFWPSDENQKWKYYLLYGILRYHFIRCVYYFFLLLCACYK